MSPLGTLAAGRPRRRLGPVGLTVMVVALAGSVTVASALPPGGAGNNPGTAVVSISTNPVVVGGVVRYTGSGFSANEEITALKIDDGNWFKKSLQDSYSAPTANAAGEISGSVKLSDAVVFQDQTQDPVKPPVDGTIKAGTHSLRFLSGTQVDGKGRTFKVDFEVVDALPGPGGTPTPTPTVPVTPGAPTPTPGGGSDAPQGTTPSALVAPTLGTTPIKLKGSKATVKLVGSSAAVSGKLRIVSKSKLKTGRTGKAAKAKQRVLFSTKSFSVGAGASASVPVVLTADGRKLLKAKKAKLKAVVTVTDAAGKPLVTKTITVTR